jgi:hypothetical protein
VKNEVVELKPGLKRARLVKDENIKEEEMNFSGSPRAFCIVSRFPYFYLHFDVLVEILGEIHFQKFSLDQRIKMFESPVLVHNNDKSNFLFFIFYFLFFLFYIFYYLFFIFFLFFIFYFFYFF